MPQPHRQTTMTEENEEKMPAEAKSINSILRENCRERLYVQPLHWVQRHLDLLDCTFVQDNSIVPSLLRSPALPSPPPDDLSPASGHSRSPGSAVPQPPTPKDASAVPRRRRNRLSCWGIRSDAVEAGHPIWSPSVSSWLLAEGEGRDGMYIPV